MLLAVDVKRPIGLMSDQSALNDLAAVSFLCNASCTTAHMAMHACRQRVKSRCEGKPNSHVSLEGQ